MLAISKYTPFTTLSIATGYFCNCKSGYSFRFNGMEDDNETYGDGNALDFGARIYDSRLGRWLSVDPLASIYPSLSPYTFVMCNPIILIDDDGKEVLIKVDNDPNAEPIIYTPNMTVPKGATKFVTDAIMALNYIHNTTVDKEGASPIQKLVESKATLSIVQTLEYNNTHFSGRGTAGGTLFWNNYEAQEYSNGWQSPIVSFAHEIDHAGKQFELIKSARETQNYNELMDFENKSSFEANLPEERRATFGLESVIASKLNQAVRDDYDAPLSIANTDNIFSFRNSAPNSLKEDNAIINANKELQEFGSSDTKIRQDKIKNDNPIKK